MEQLPDLPDVPSRLEFARRAAKLSRKALSEALAQLGIEAGKSSIQRYEYPKENKFHRTPDASYVAGLSQLSGIPSDWMLMRQAASGVDLRAARQQIRGQIEGLFWAQRDADEQAGVPHVPNPQAVFEEADRILSGRHSAKTLEPIVWECWLAIRDGAQMSGGYRPRSSEKA